MKMRQISAILAMILLLSPVHGLAVEVLSVYISEKEWTWEPGGIAVFEGTVVYEGNIEDDPLTLTLTLESTPSIPEKDNIVFASVNDQKLSRMKQKSQYVIQKDTNKVIRFTGNLILPDELILTGAILNLTVTSREGRKLGEASFSAYDKTGEDAVSARFIFPDLTRWIRIALAGTALIWIIVLVRIMYYHKRRGE